MDSTRTYRTQNRSCSRRRRRTRLPLCKVWLLLTVLAVVTLSLVFGNQNINTSPDNRPEPTPDPSTAGRDDSVLHGWITSGDRTYFYTEDGTMAVGWLETSDATYYFDEMGQMTVGWMNTDEARYYFTADGKMAVGFLEVDGLERYFSSDGNYVPLVNPWNPVPEDYHPNLVELWGFEIDSSCSDQLKMLVMACRNAGHICVLNSTYRSINTQQYLWDNRYNSYKAEGFSDEEATRLTARRVAYPGTSEHHTGLAVDITGTEDMYDWFSEHSWEYGFIVRYPDDKEPQTGIMYEPWHLRYVGNELAKAVYDSGLCLEEYLEFLKQ